jgi:predicted transcriptional regulator
MAKTRTSFALSDEALRLLKLLAEKNDRSQANMLEQLIKEAAAKQKIT